MKKRVFRERRRKLKENEIKKNELKEEVFVVNEEFDYKKNKKNKRLERNEFSIDID